MKKSTLIILACAFALLIMSPHCYAGPATGKTLNGQQLREGMIGQSKEQVQKWFGSPSRTNGRDWTYENLIIRDVESGATLNVMSVIFSSEEGGVVESVRYLKSY